MTFRLLRILAVALVAYLAVALAPASAGAATGGSCDISQFNDYINTWSPERSAALVTAINSAREARNLPDLHVDATLWQGAMWEAAYTEKWRFSKNITAPCATDAFPLFAKMTHGDSAKNVLAEMKILNPGYDKLFSPDYHSIGIGVVSNDSEATVVLLGAGEATAPPAAVIKARTLTSRVGSMPTVGSPYRSVNLATLIASNPGYFSVASFYAQHGTTPAAFEPNYRPNTGFHGVDRATYTIADFYGRTASGTVLITVGDGKQVVKQIVKKKVVKKSPAMVLFVGGTGNKVYLSQYKMAYVAYAVAKPGLAIVTVKKGSHAIASAKVRLAGSQGGAFPLSKVISAAHVALGSYSLSVRVNGQSKTVSFTVHP